MRRPSDGLAYGVYYYQHRHMYSVLYASWIVGSQTARRQRNRWVTIHRCETVVSGWGGWIEGLIGSHPRSQSSDPAYCTSTESTQTRGFQEEVRNCASNPVRTECCLTAFLARFFARSDAWIAGSARGYASHSSFLTLALAY